MVKDEKRGMNRSVTDQSGNTGGEEGAQSGLGLDASWTEPGECRKRQCVDWFVCVCVFWGGCFWEILTTLSSAQHVAE